MAYNTIDPIGRWREDYKMSYMASVISNNFIRAFGKKNSKMQPVSDFNFPWQPNNRKEMSQDQLTEALMAWAANHNKAVEANEKKNKKTPPKK